jgi:hypothetical protein
MPTSRRLVQFSEGKTAPDGGQVVYIDGAFDMFHPGHVEILKVGVGAAGGRMGALGLAGWGAMRVRSSPPPWVPPAGPRLRRALSPPPLLPGAPPPLQLAKAQGDFLLVGLHSDDDVATRRGCAAGASPAAPRGAASMASLRPLPARSEAPAPTLPLLGRRRRRLNGCGCSFAPVPPTAVPASDPTDPCPRPPLPRAPAAAPTCPS